MKYAIIPTALAIFGVFASVEPASGDEVDAGQPDARVLKFYPLGELTQPARQFPFQPGLPASTAVAGMPITLAGGLGGAQGMPPGAGPGGGGFGGGGGGLFSVPTPAQFGGGGGMGGTGGGGMGGGFGGAVNFGIQQHSVIDSSDEHESLIRLIMEHIDPDSWQDNGGEASISAANNTLLIRQTKANHDAIATFLKNFAAHTVGGQPLTVELWWLPLNAAAQRNLKQDLQADDAAAELSRLSESVGGYHGILKARNRITGHLCSGHRMPLVIGRVPVVGTDAIGHQPQVAHVNIGIMAEVTPQFQEDWQGDGIRLLLRTAMTTLQEHEQAAEHNGEIDRFQLGNHVLETNAVCQVGKPAVAGSLTAVGLFPDADEDRELVVVVLVSRP
ncbi:MAG: hypothetical protein RIK87_05150 [Fuerstiella sp.]